MCALVVAPVTARAEPPPPASAAGAEEALDQKLAVWRFDALGIDTAVGAYLVDNHGMLLTELKYTIAVAALGLVLGMTLGLILAVAVWSSKVLGGFLIPVVVIVQSFPVVAMVPLIARVMGYDIKTVITIAIIISFFSTFILGRAGLDRHSAGAADVFRVLGATRRSFLWRLALPSAIPNLLIALRLCAANCILATLVGEYLMGTRGLGSLIAVAQSTQQLPLAWAAAVLASGVSIAAFFAASRIEKRGAKRWT